MKVKREYEKIEEENMQDTLVRFAIGHHGGGLALSISLLANSRDCNVIKVDGGFDITSDFHDMVSAIDKTCEQAEKITGYSEKERRAFEMLIIEAVSFAADTFNGRKHIKEGFHDTKDDYYFRGISFNVRFDEAQGYYLKLRFLDHNKFNIPLIYAKSTDLVEASSKFDKKIVDFFKNFYRVSRKWHKKNSTSA